mgnify:CR=1 FL=1
MHLEFKIFRDAVDSNAYPEMLDEEIDVYLNEAMDRVVKLRYGKNNLYRKGFEEIQKRTDDLKELVVSRFSNLSFFEEGDLFIWTTDDGTLTKFLITFIKKPIRMDLSAATDCELSEHLHKEIVQTAVDISLENLQSPRVQSNIKNMQTIE